VRAFTFWIILLAQDLSVGGHFVGAPNAKMTFPQKFLIDYVRVYQ